MRPTEDTFIELKVHVTWGVANPYTITYLCEYRDRSWHTIAEGYDIPAIRMRRLIPRAIIREDYDITWRTLAALAIWRYEQYLEGVNHASGS